MVGAWADRHHVGAREAFAQGGRAELERAGFAPPSFLPVAATMLVVGAMLVWVLAVFLRLGYRWGQLGLSALMLACGVREHRARVRARPTAGLRRRRRRLVAGRGRGRCSACGTATPGPTCVGPWVGGPGADDGVRRRREAHRRSGDPAPPDRVLPRSRRPLVRCRWGGVPFSCSNICSITPVRGGRPRPPSVPGPGSTGVDREWRRGEGSDMRQYDDPVETRMGQVSGMEAPEQFLWRGRLWKVRAVLAHWVETGPWWQSGGARAVIGSDEPGRRGLDPHGRRRPVRRARAVAGRGRPWARPAPVRCRARRAGWRRWRCLRPRLRLERRALGARRLRGLRDGDAMTSPFTAARLAARDHPLLPRPGRRVAARRGGRHATSPPATPVPTSRPCAPRPRCWPPGPGPRRRRGSPPPAEERLGPAGRGRSRAGRVGEVLRRRCRQAGRRRGRAPPGR